MCEKIKNPTLQSSRILNLLLDILKFGKKNGGATGKVTPQEIKLVREATGRREQRKNSIEVV